MADLQNLQERDKILKSIEERNLRIEAVSKNNAINQDLLNRYLTKQENLLKKSFVERKKTNLGKGTNNELELVMHDLPVPEHLRKDQ